MAIPLDLSGASPKGQIFAYVYRFLLSKEKKILENFLRTAALNPISL